MVSVGTIVWLSSELMFFAALFAMYFTLRSVSPSCGPPSPSCSTSRSRRVNTTVLVLSSVTCQLGVFAAERGDVGHGCGCGSSITFLMGAFFVAGQVYEYAALVATRASRSPSNAVRLGLLPRPPASTACTSPAG